MSSVSNPSSEIALSVCLVNNSVLPFFLGLPTIPMTFILRPFILPRFIAIFTSGAEEIRTPDLLRADYATGLIATNFEAKLLFPTYPSFNFKTLTCCPYP
jgi:hypothetical protein